ncbi:hypothetical protein LY622_13690 [Halomonas sp. M5N1S17]|uniref:hypothetical protein n=1 Tax=Halomonas alkalisoli TaxID=2907158 RepID=UPI001F412EA6|nr:hypothetical protein [Halomonas alkalisoli]MCE9664486.1 hypothetical protein [Halomonas alkalisoli]
MIYEAWRITYQSAEQAAQAAYRAAQEHLARAEELEQESAALKDALANMRGVLDTLESRVNRAEGEAAALAAKGEQAIRALSAPYDAEWRIDQARKLLLDAPTSQLTSFKALAQAEILEEEFPEMFDQVDANRLEKRAIDLRHKAKASTPALRKLIAEKQAEALEEAADDCVADMHQMANWLRCGAREKRRQAEGGR